VKDLPLELVSFDICARKKSIEKKGNWTTPPGYLSSFKTSVETQIQQIAIPILLQKSIHFDKKEE